MDGLSFKDTRGRFSDEPVNPDPVQIHNKNVNVLVDHYSRASWSKEKVLIIGLGQLGLPVAKYVNDRGFDVYGYDISSKAIDRAQKIA